MERILDAQTASIVDQIKLLLQDLRARGLDEDQIACIVRKDEGTGRVAIERGYLVLLDEKDIRVRLTPMERTLYTFLARYPEGIAPDSLWKYWDELKDIYESQSVFGDMELIEDSIDAICEDDRKTLYTNISRIRKKLKDKGGDWIAQRYSIRRNDAGMYVLPVTMKGC